MAYLPPKSEYNGYRYIAASNLSNDFSCFLFTPREAKWGPHFATHIKADTDRYRIRCTGVERWEVKDMHENLILNVDYQTKTFEEAYDLLCNHVNNPQNDTN